MCHTAASVARSFIMVHHAGIMAAARREGRRQRFYMAEAAPRPRPLPFAARAAPPTAAPHRIPMPAARMAEAAAMYRLPRARRLLQLQRTASQATTKIAGQLLS